MKHLNKLHKKNKRDFWAFTLLGLSLVLLAFVVFVVQKSQELRSRASGPVTASLTVNGLKDITANVGDSLTFTWSSTGADTFYTYGWNTDPVNSVMPTECSFVLKTMNSNGTYNKVQIANSASGSVTVTVPPIAASMQTPCQYGISFGVSNSFTKAEASDIVTMRINPYPYETISGGIGDNSSNNLKGVTVTIANKTNFTQAQVTTDRYGQFNLDGFIKYGDTYSVTPEDSNISGICTDPPLANIYMCPPTILNTNINNSGETNFYTNQKYFSMGQGYADTDCHLNCSFIYNSNTVTPTLPPPPPSIQGGVDIGGKITESTTNNPIKGVWVQLYNYRTGSGPELYTDSNGNFLFKGQVLSSDQFDLFSDGWRANGKCSSSPPIYKYTVNNYKCPPHTTTAGNRSLYYFQQYVGGPNGNCALLCNFSYDPISSNVSALLQQPTPTPASTQQSSSGTAQNITNQQTISSNQSAAQQSSANQKNVASNKNSVSQQGSDSQQKVSTITQSPNSQVSPTPAPYFFAEGSSANSRYNQIFAPITSRSKDGSLLVDIVVIILLFLGGGMYYYYRRYIK